MSSNKLQNLMLKYKLTNIIKVCIIIIVLFLIYQLFTTQTIIVNPADITNYKKKNIMVNPANITNYKKQNLGLQYNNNTCNGDSDSDGNNSNSKYINIIENFESNGDLNYGNQIILNDPNQLPVYTDNKCTFIFNGIYRLEALEIVFNTANNAMSNATKKYADTSNKGVSLPIYIQYYDSDGNLKYIKSINGNFISVGSPPTFTALSNNLNITNLVDENNLAIYTSKIVISIGLASNKIDAYKSSTIINDKYNRYIKNFALYGSTREMISYSDYNNLILNTNDFNLVKSGTLNYTTDTTLKLNKYIYNYSITDLNVYSIKLLYNIFTPTLTSAQTTAMIHEPCKVNISYNNTLYPGNTFKINTIYYIRIDPQIINANLSSADTLYYVYIYFKQPIIVNQFMISISSNPTGRQIRFLDTINTHSEETSTDIISNYKKTVNTILNNSAQDTQLNVCPSLDIIVTKQNQVQQLCDNLDYQDKIAAEKIRLEKNKQYLLKLQEQQKQIDDLNNVLTTLDTKRATRAKNSDVTRVLQYQNQKNTASKIIDLANERLESQDNNNLYLDVNINGTQLETANTTTTQTQRAQ